MLKIFKKTSLLLLSASLIGASVPSIVNVSAAESTILAQTTRETLEETLREAIQTKFDNKFVGSEYPKIITGWRREYTETGELVNHGLKVNGSASLYPGTDFEIRNFGISRSSVITFDIVFSGLYKSKPKIERYYYGKRLKSHNVETSADVDITARAVIELCNNNNNNAWKSRVFIENRKVKDIYMARTLSFEGYSSQEIEDFVEGAIKRSLQLDFQTTLAQVLLDAINYNDSVKSEYQKLTNLPNCQ